MRAFAEHLTALDVPIFTAPPASDREFARPTGWQKLTAEANAAQIAAHRQGDALMGLMGGAVAVGDVDTKNGGDPARVRQTLDALGITVYADVLTPSGGRHFYVAGHPDLPTVHAEQGRDGLTGHPGVEIISYGANVFLPGTSRPKYDGAGYVVLDDNLEALADGGDPDGAEALAAWVAEHRVHTAADFEPSPPRDGAPLDKRQAAYLEKALARMCADLAAMAPNTGRNKALYTAALKCGSFVSGAGMDEQQVVDRLTAAAAACGLTTEDGPRSVAASIGSGLRNGRKKPKAAPPPKGQAAPPGSGAPGAPLPLLGALLTGLRQWQDLPDPTHVITGLAVAATRQADGEACWLLLVAPPSSGKTEAVRILDDTADARLDELTAAGLLGWSKGKVVRPTGVLARVGARALITFGDLSTLLATSDRGGRDHVFGLLRRAYDGYTSRDISPPAKVADGYPEKLEWSGRLTVVACVTGAIDRYTAHADQLGARWLYVRLPDRNTAKKRQAAALARRGALAEHRADARGAAVALLAALPDLPDLPDPIADAIEDAALVTAWGRGSVPRNGYGRREIEGMPVVEEPMRLVQQLGAVARGVLALGLPETAATAIARRVALDSMPEARRAVLAALSTGELLSTAGIAKGAKLHRHVARFQLEELAAIGVVTNDRTGDEDDEPSGVVNWFLLGDDGKLIAEVFGENKRAGGWHETWVQTTPSPLEGEEGDEGAIGNPTLRATPDDQAGAEDCSTCGQPLHYLRIAYGKTVCVPCERQAAS